MVRIMRISVLAIIGVALLLPFSMTAANSQDESSSDAKKRVLFKTLARASNELEGKIAEGDIWQYWFNQSPTPEVRSSLDAGMARREAYDYEAAEAHLDKVVELAPDYAEGYNQRAFVRFLRENYTESQTDLEIVLELEPDHFGAMAGLYQILWRQSRQKVAMSVLQRAVEIHPWIQERFALPKDMWPEGFRRIHEPGQEI